MGEMVVSVVEDDETVLSLLSELLQGQGFDAREVLIGANDTLETSLARIAANAAPVVILDLSMPVSGLRILEASLADARFAEARWLIATANSDGAAQVPKSPRVRVVAKPYDIPRLLRAIEGES